MTTLPVGVQDLSHTFPIEWGLVMVAGVLITILALAMFVAGQGHPVAGRGNGALQG